MPTPEEFKLVAWEDSGPILMARITGNDGANITQASLTDVKLTVMDGDTEQTAQATLVKADVVFDTLQKTSDDARWTADNTGYNFKHEVVATDLPNGEKTYTFEFMFNPASGQDFALVFVIDTKKLRSQ